MSECCKECLSEFDDRDMGHVVSCSNRDCKCHDGKNEWQTFIKMCQRRKLTDLTNGWTGRESGPCCKDCKIDSSKPIGNMAALIGCSNPFQIKEQNYGGKKLCQCHIPYRKSIADRVNRTLDNLIEVIKKRDD